MTKKTINPELINAYMETLFSFPEIGTIHVGKYNACIKRMLHSLGFICGAIITAYNPYSQQCSEDQNIANNNLLLKDLHEYKVFIGGGQDPLGHRPIEVSFLVQNIKLDYAIELGNKYEQNAIVWLTQDGSELVML